MLNDKQLKAAVEKYKNTVPAARKALMEQEFKSDEITQINEALAKLQPPPSKPQKEETVTADETPDLSAFDYSNLSRKSLIAYFQMIAGLKWNRKMMFQEYKVETRKAPRFRGVQGSPIDIVGVRLKDAAPVKERQMEVRAATTMNGVVIIEDGEGEDKKFFFEDSQFQQSGRIWLLKK